MFMEYDIRWTNALIFYYERLTLPLKRIKLPRFSVGKVKTLTLSVIFDYN